MSEKLNVYLAGLISTEAPESLVWREWAKQVLQADDRVHVITPMDSKRDLHKFTRDGGVTDLRLEPGDIILRDYADVCRAHLVLANLNIWGSQRQMLGTWCELGWAWELRIPVIGISDLRDRNHGLVTRHPFVRAMVAHYFATVEAACDFILDYYARR